MTADKIKESEVGQLDFRGNLKKSLTSENLAELVDEDTSDFKPCVTPELEEKLNMQLSKNFESETQFHTCEDAGVETQSADPKKLIEVENEISMSRTSVYSLASSSSKASFLQILSGVIVAGSLGQKRS